MSLQQQKAAIEAYAQREHIDIVEWFEETLTAAKQGRPLFSRMLKALRRGLADGVVIHKVDRGARNFRDWADIGELIDGGIQVRFANENLDVQTRGGRLSADIQAIVAADYIRNLREEVRKGIKGRLKQGITPFAAPVGYLNMGKGGRVKEIDPVLGPLARRAFELYDSGRFGLHALRVELNRLGLRNKDGRPLSLSSMSQLLNNPFYAGLIRIKRTGETFPGAHTPLITMSLFKRVKERLAGRVPRRQRKHDYLFRGLFHCSLCNRSLIGERQKGHIYYRCQTKTCPTTTFREEVLEDAVVAILPPSRQLPPTWRTSISHLLDAVMSTTDGAEHERRAQVQLQLAALKVRQARLVDAMVDGVIKRELFNERHAQLLEEQRLLEESLKTETPKPEEIRQQIIGALELAGMAQQSYKLGNPESKRELVLQMTSNRTAAGKTLVVEPYLPLSAFSPLGGFREGAPHRCTTRTLQEIARELIEWAKSDLLRKRE